MVLASVLGVLPQVEAPPAVASHGVGAVTLVSNLGQASQNITDVDLDSEYHSQGFTTGDFAGGYALSSVEVSMGVTGTLSAADVAKVRAELWSRDGTIDLFY